MARAKTVLATGAFDILHVGHIRFLEESKKQGGPGAKLVVVVARDRTVLARKGRKPVMPEAQRLKMVASLKPVNKAILGHETVDFLGILRTVKPDIVCVGHDQPDIKRTVERIARTQNLPLRVVQIGRFGPGNLNSSTSVKKRILRSLRPSRA